jgi:arsenite methyltransferase
MSDNLADFSEKIISVSPELLYFENLEILQVNLGNLCNQSCKHCHVNAGPDGKNIMDRQTIDKVVRFIKNYPDITLDITGGAPEIHPDFVYLIEKIEEHKGKKIVRTNLTIITEDTMDWLPEFYRDHNIVITASLPCYSRENVDTQRGNGVFEKSIKALKMLNEVGYSRSHELNLVYNPNGPTLPPSQDELEGCYREKLSQNFNTEFNNLYTIINNPVGRFEKVLRLENGYEDYIKMLSEHFNPDAAQNIMCRTLVSVNWEGKLFNCDFNQAKGLPIRDRKGKVICIDEIEDLLSGHYEILTGEHCYSCTAGLGSSCTGEIAEDNQNAYKDINDYYGKVLKNSNDLKTSACCSIESIPLYQRKILNMIEPEILDRFYGCGSPIPLCLKGCKVIDLGCGTGRDVYLASKLVGEKGFVIGVDMTSEQLMVARKNIKKQMENFGYKKSNVEFLNGHIEKLDEIGIGDSFADVVISNCVINLSPDKRSVFREIFRVLKPGGELFFSDVFAGQRVPEQISADPVLRGECLGGAMYIEDFRRMLRDLGCYDFRVVSKRKIKLNNPKIEEMAGMIDFYSMTIRVFKLNDLEDVCEDYGQTAVYLGTIPECSHSFILDDHHTFIKNKPLLVCGNTASMLLNSRYKKHFNISGNRKRHFGLFECSNASECTDNPQGGSCC